jgi:glycosyltransferase involved in cell wall biosynthesis
MTTIAFVSPRYGPQIVGGAERLVRGLAEQLAAAGHTVEVLSTCTQSVAEIRNTLPPGASVLNGVTVRRFPADATDIARYHRVAALAASGAPVPYADQLEFIRHALNSGPLYEHLRSHRDSYQAVIFAPYLFGTTYWGAQAVPEKAIILPCLHDEPYAHFEIFREMLEGAQGIIFNSRPERDLAYEKLGLVNPRSAVVGMAFAPQPPGDGAAFRRRRGLAGNVLFFSARLEAGKNVPLLAEYFARYSDERPGAWTLALGGSGELALPDRPDIVRLGFIPEPELPDAFAAATLFCQPSLNESLSIVLMEAWLQGRPALVHADSAVTSFHVARSGGGLAFSSYEEFRAALDRIAADPAAADAMGARGREYVLAEYAPSAVMGRLQEALGRFTAPRSQYDLLSQRGIVHALSFSRARFDERFERALSALSAEAVEGIGAQQLAALRQSAQVGMPDYMVRSGAPVVGPLIAWLRRTLTSHLREPYLDPIIARQEQFNRQVLDVLLPAIERGARGQRRLERQIRLLERRLDALERSDGGAE